jgi:hypothetical protein
VGKSPETLWFHVTHHQLPFGTAVTTYTGDEDLGGWRTLLEGAGGDPWPDPPPWAPPPHVSNLHLAPGDSATVNLPDGPDTVTGLWIAVDDEALDQIVLEARFDGRTTVLLSLRDFFWLGAAGGVRPATVFVGSDETGRFTSFWPMPYHRDAELVFHHLGAAGASTHEIQVTVRNSGRAPVAGAGSFTAFERAQDPTNPDTEFVMLDETGRGRIVGLFLDLQSVDTDLQHYLEGDAKLHLDGMTAPTWHGTGVEDTFGGGFYYDRGPFALPLHGAVHAGRATDGEIATTSYRLFLTDSPLYCSGARWTLENGPGPPTGHVPMRARAVVLAYTHPNVECGPTDVLNLGDAASLAAHAFTSAPEATPAFLDSTFTDGPGTTLAMAGLVQNQPGVWRFVLSAPPTAGALKLRRLSDGGLVDDGALLCLDGEEIGAWPRRPQHPTRRWREDELVLPAELAGPLELSIQMVGSPGSAAHAPLFNAFRLELHTHEPLIFIDGFETGDATAWVTSDRAPRSSPASARSR